MPSKRILINIFLLFISSVSFQSLASGGGTGGGSSSASVPFMNPLLNVLMMVIIVYIYKKHNK